MTSEEIETGSTETETSEATESPSPESTESQPAQVETAPKQEETPFHEHPRFKELVEQKNQAIAQQKALESRLAEFEKRLNQPAPQAIKQAERDELIEDLKKIDPRLASRLEAFSKASETTAQLQSRLEKFEQAQAQQVQQQVLQTAIGKINSLHEANKVNPFVKQVIESQLDLTYRSGKLDAKDLSAVEAAYKDVLDKAKAYEEDLKRETLKSYVPGKKADAATPTSQPKGTPAKPASKPKAYSTDREVRMQQLAQEYVKAQTRTKEASSV